MGFLDMKAEIGDLGWEADGASDSTVMILTCPECATSYFVDDSRIPSAGRTVKCSNCGARWTALPGGAAPARPSPSQAKPAPAAAAVAEVDELVVEGPLTTAPPVTAKAPGPRREARGKVVIWAGSAVAAGMLIAAAIGFRAQVVQLFPASQAAYAGLGMPVSALAIEKVHVDPVFQGGRPVLAVTGQVRNLRDEPALSPPLRVSLLDRFGKPVAIKVARPINTAVPAKAVRYFAISIVDPPASVHDLEVAFDAEGKGKGKGGKGASAKAAVPPSAAAPPAGPQPVEAKALPPGSPDALPTHP
jgi:predicted Zn finger-like uncharacterized protein